MIAIGVQTWGTDVSALRRYWALADALGYARLTYGDGLGDWTYDGWAALGAMAVATRRIRLGPAVTYGFDASSHHPSWLAKRAVTVDRLSDGRLDLRLGVGAESPDAAAQWARHGIPYPSAGARLQRLEETVAILRRLWSGDAVGFEGRFYTLRNARLAPAPRQRPAPPIWVAAMGARALGVAARCADGWEASYVSPPALATRWSRLRALLEAGGRPPDSVRRSVELDVVLARDAREAEERLAGFRAARGIGPRHPLLDAVLAGDAGAVRERIARYAVAGATDLTLGFADFPETGMLEAFAATVLPRLGDGR